jgi:hypothetical protein
MAMASDDDFQYGGMSFPNDEKAVSRDFQNGGPPGYFQRDALRFPTWCLTCS